MLFWPREIVSLESKVEMCLDGTVARVFVGYFSAIVFSGTC